MLVVEVNVLDAQALQRSIAGLVHVLRLAADHPVGWIVLLAYVRELGRKKHLVAPPANRPADQFLVVADPVGISGIQKVDSQIERPQYRGRRFRIVALAVEFAHPHAAKSHARNNRAL
jgi:hypothetical protein